MSRAALVIYAVALLSVVVGCQDRATKPVAPSTSTQEKPATTEANPRRQPADCVNLNTATAEALMALPEIGEVMAQKIIEYRQQNGGFRRPQEIIILDGFSEKKYRALAHLLCVE